ncbi:MAG: cell division protein FtsZ [Acidimicrobiales bacterium]|nr:cell division protein FtsZ [Hyphomonadaceae bacterium]RZV35446.1 MAG: cell division protein FtsZ [Acidimicrobiales bacterium]
MSISLSLPKSVELKPRIVVIGVGGAGGNAVNNMITSGLDGVEFVVANTDAQALALSKADRRIQMGSAITQGLGAGMRPHVGEEAAENSLAEIMEHLDGAHMLFVAAGMGGGTGTGAAPVIAKAARERGILTVAIVTKPFQFEGSKRMKLADEGIENLYSCVDTLIVIPNQNLFRVATENTTMADAFGMADEVLNSGVRGVTDLMVVPGLINLDFADVRTVMDEMGKAMMGTGEATGERRAIEAAESAISNPLLDDVSLKGAKGVLINITGGNDLTLYEVDEAASLIRGQVDPDANIIVGSALDGDLDGIVRVSVVATGVSGDENFVAQRFETEAVVEQEEAIFDEEEASQADEEFEIAAEFEPETAPVAQPIAQPVVAQAPKQATSGYTYRQPEPRRAPEPAPVPVQEMPPVDSQTVVKRPFGFFGRKKSVPVAPKAEPNQVPTQTGDLFGSDAEDELEIPSFLRRQN